MPTSFGEPLTKLRAVPIRDNGEPLVDPCTQSKRIVFQKEHPVFTDMERVPHVRKSLAEMLAKAADSLPEGLGISIFQGFRSMEQQRFMHKYVGDRLREKHPEWNTATMNRMVNRLSAPPDDKCPPPHTTGGAVDLALLYLESGETLDMMSPFEETDEMGAPTYTKGLSETAQANRALLIQTLEAVGITNYTGEWWHWSYGDSGWALRTGAPFALYDRLPEVEANKEIQK